MDTTIYLLENHANWSIVSGLLDRMCVANEKLYGVTYTEDAKLDLGKEWIDNPYELDYKVRGLEIRAGLQTNINVN